MKSTLYITAVIITLLFMFLQCSSPEIIKEPNTLKPFENVSLEELKIMAETGNITKPHVNIRGIVLQKFICPPCPEGYDFEQCPENHIVVSDGKSDISIICNPEHFMEKEEYCFSLERKKYINGFPFNITGWEKNPGKNCQPCR